VRLHEPEQQVVVKARAPANGIGKQRAIVGVAQCLRRRQLLWLLVAIASAAIYSICLANQRRS
jgi:hypothetical protein